MVIGALYPLKCTFLILEEQIPRNGEVKGGREMDEFEMNFWMNLRS